VSVCAPVGAACFLALRGTPHTDLGLCRSGQHPALRFIGGANDGANDGANGCIRGAGFLSPWTAAPRGGRAVLGDICAMAAVVLSVCRLPPCGTAWCLIWHFQPVLPRFAYWLLAIGPQPAARPPKGGGRRAAR
jgi:hypothetical protein